jgi:hypothetical protein
MLRVVPLEGKVSAAVTAAVQRQSEAQDSRDPDWPKRIGELQRSETHHTSLILREARYHERWVGGRAVFRLSWISRPDRGKLKNR